MSDAVVDWSTQVQAIAGAIATINALITHEWWIAALFALISATGTVRWIRRHKSRRVLADWPTERVRSVVGDADVPFAGAKLLRATDSRLTRRDSLKLVLSAVDRRGRTSG